MIQVEEREWLAQSLKIYCLYWTNMESFLFMDRKMIQNGRKEKKLDQLHHNQALKKWSTTITIPAKIIGYL